MIELAKVDNDAEKTMYSMTDEINSTDRVNEVSNFTKPKMSRSQLEQRSLLQLKDEAASALDVEPKPSNDEQRILTQDPSQPQHPQNDGNPSFEEAAGMTLKQKTFESNLEPMVPQYNQQTLKGAHK